MAISLEGLLAGASSGLTGAYKGTSERDKIRREQEQLAFENMLKNVQMEELRAQGRRAAAQQETSADEFNRRFDLDRDRYAAQAEADRARAEQYRNYQPSGPSPTSASQRRATLEMAARGLQFFLANNQSPDYMGDAEAYLDKNHPDLTPSERNAVFQQAQQAGSAERRAQGRHEKAMGDEEPTGFEADPKYQQLYGGGSLSGADTVIQGPQNDFASIQAELDREFAEVQRETAELRKRMGL